VLDPSDRASDVWYLTEALAHSGNGLVIEALFAAATADGPPEVLIYAVDRLDFEAALLRSLREQGGPALHVGNFLAALAGQGLSGATAAPLTEADDRALTVGLAETFAVYLRGGSEAIWTLGALHIGPLLLPDEGGAPERRGGLSPPVDAMVRRCMAQPQSFLYLQALARAGLRK
jgi:hypothetical protein